MTSEVILEKLRRLESSNVRLELNCSEYFVLASEPQSNIAKINAKYYPERNAHIQIYYNGSIVRRKFINELFEKMNSIPMGGAVWTAISIAVDSIQTDVNMQNNLIEAFLSDNYVIFKKNSEGKIYFVENSGIKWDDYIRMEANKKIPFNFIILGFESLIKQIKKLLTNITKRK